MTTSAAMGLPYCDPEIEVCDPDGGGGGGGGPTIPYFGMILNTFFILQDHENFSSMEVEFHFSTSLAGHSDTQLRYTGVHQGYEELPRDVIWYLPQCETTCTSNPVFSVTVIETDFGSDDYLGHISFAGRNGLYEIHDNACWRDPGAYIDPCYVYPSVHEVTFSTYYPEQ